MNQSTIITDEPSRPASNESSALLIRGLSKSYREGSNQRWVLQDLNLAVAHGEIVAILGKSGSGKSTLLNIISGIDVADHGELWIGGQNLTAVSEEERTLIRRKSIGFVFQFFNLLPTQTATENVALTLELNGESPSRARSQAVEMLTQIGLAHRLNAFPDQLSGGEQQRVAIARALIHQPALILADEPTGNLDEDNGRAILGQLNALTRQRNSTLVLVTHSAEAAAIADRVLTLKQGHFS